MFTESAQAVIDLAKNYSSGSTSLALPAILAAMMSRPGTRVLFEECFGTTIEELKANLPEYSDCATGTKKLPLSEPVRLLLSAAKELAQEVPNQRHPGLIDARHLVCAAGMSQEACAFLNVTPQVREDALAMLAKWHALEVEAPRLDDLTERLRALRDHLLANLFGQDHAVHAFVEGLFNAEIVAAADTERRNPRALFVFAGPPGVGKTLLAELGASYLDRPFKRFDMSGYSAFHANEGFVGTSRSFAGSHPGALTDFVENNPNAVLLFDEIEKAHPDTVNLFLQILDAGRLEDKHYEREVTFRDTTIIFTTNAGRRLYDRPNASGVLSANASFHRSTILDALQSDKNLQTGQPFFPPPICSRMGTGYPVLFNQLGINELERVVRAALERFGSMFLRQYYRQVTFDAHLPMCLVLREGARADARMLSSQAETFVKAEILKFCQLFRIGRIEEVLSQVERIHFCLEKELSDVDSVKSLFDQPSCPRVLLVTNKVLTELYRDYIGEVDWRTANSTEEALRALASEELDFAILDLWFGGAAGNDSATIERFDHMPVGAKSLQKGQELLRKIRERLPNLPVYLLSIVGSGVSASTRAIDEELFMACVRAGGARGTLITRFTSAVDKGSDSHKEFLASVLEIARLLCRERAAAQLARERKVLIFDTAPHIDQRTREVSIRLRNLRVTRAIAAADAGEVMEEVERPRIGFDDVIGAAAAKEEMRFFIDFLKNPRRFAALGLKVPKGVLLYGPPGTGKTMLARAMAGESEVAFVPVTASNFVTMWQGSGPQSVRDLFERARRYAPAIIFIDEIDAIGRVRIGSPGAGHGEEMALNALLTEMDGFAGPSPDRPVFVLAATNFRIRSEDLDSAERSARTLDPALVRRFSRTIFIDLPDASDRKRYLASQLREGAKVEISDSVIDLAVEKTVGMTIADLEGIIEAAIRAAVKNNHSLSDQLLLETIDNIREGEAKQWSPEFLESTARHEAGHTIMYWLSGWWPPEVSIVARGDHGGGMRRNEIEMRRESLTREQMLARVRTCLGGRAAELLYYGADDGLTTGASGDLQQATNVARQMICCYGMDEEFGLLVAPEFLTHAGAISSPLYQQIAQASSRILKEQMERTQDLLIANRVYLDAVANALQARNRLYRKDLEEILPLPPVEEAAARPQNTPMVAD
jgi:cell division protease FtsH